MIVNAGSSGQQSSTQSASLSYDSRGETTPSVNKTSADIGTSVTITTKPYVSSFSHKLYYSTDGGKSKVSIGTVSAGTTTKSWTIPTSLASQIPNDASILITIVCETYNGSSKVGGDKTCTLTATVPSTYKPSISSVSISEATAGLASQFGVYVQSKSTLKIVTSASGSNGSTIKSVSVACDGFTYSGTTVTTGTISSSGNVSIVVTVTDSRGRTASTTKTVNVVAYSAPAITTSTVTRANSSGTASDEGTYALFNYAYSITNVNNRNTHTFSIQYKSGSSWITLVTYTDYVKSGKYLSTRTFDVNSAFEFRFVVTDYFGSYTIEKSIDISFALMNFGANGHSMAVGMQSPNDSYFDLNLPGRFRQTINLMGNLSLGTLAKQVIGKFIYPVGSVIINTTGTNPGTQFGGTWEQFAPGRFLIGAGTGNDGSTSMTFTAGSTGGKYTIDLKHYHHAPTGYDGNNYYMGRIDGAGPDYVETDTSLGYAFSGGSSSASATRHFATSYSLDKKNIQSPYVAVYFWRRTA
ncbi:DUF859 family phage minor structural protein [uncultured Faecalicoccus sp.]|uniref:DUF859 family phage minor structural protein n=1 Tax=uncultured Faecalicoccus sp. TaxID=1971760 RepID=UPI00258A99EA|nr:DUF859 family phage minor structural protein [uncultured Faecalicoccus sp.]